MGLLSPAATCELYRSWKSGRSAEAGRLQERIGPLHKAVVSGTGVPGVKYALDLLGFAGGAPRSPLRPPTRAEMASIEESYRPLIAELARVGVEAIATQTGGMTPGLMVLIKDEPLYPGHEIDDGEAVLVCGGDDYLSGISYYGMDDERMNWRIDYLLICLLLPWHNPSYCKPV